MTSTLTSTYIFNQYYFDMLKKLKNISKKHKQQSTTAKKILKTIKDNECYSTYDKTSEQYREYFNGVFNDEYWTKYLALDKDECNAWLKDDSNNSLEIYKNVSIKDVTKVLRNNFLCHHYLTVLYIYKIDLSEDNITNILKILQSPDMKDEAVDELVQNEEFKKILKRLNAIKIDHMENDPRFANMDGLKDTTIGKIAKEIIEDIDLSKIKQSISEEGDIFKAIAKPDSGFGELFTNVSQKMSSKISSGELSQDAIMKDAMKFASIIPGLFGNAGGGGADGENSPGGGFDMMSMMNLMKEMNQGGAFGGAGGGGAKKQRSGVNNQALRSLMKKQQLQKKLNN
jgi:hypothetical protein